MLQDKERYEEAEPPYREALRGRRSPRGECCRHGSGPLSRRFASDSVLRCVCALAKMLMFEDDAIVVASNPGKEQPFPQDLARLRLQEAGLGQGPVQESRYPLRGHPQGRLRSAVEVRADVGYISLGDPRCPQWHNLARNRGTD